jgi:uncharacterized RDD family membrane protein YckC
MEVLDAPVQNDRQLVYAGFWIRVTAYLVDAIILGVVNIVLSFIFSGGYNPFAPNTILTLVSVVVNASYFCGMEASERQATLGKMIVGVKVGDMNGNRISVGQAVGRYFAKILSAIIFCIGFMMVGWDAKKQGLHDKLASTYVFYAN